MNGNFRLHGIGDKTLFMGAVMHFLQRRGIDADAAGENDARSKIHPRYGELARGIFLHVADGVIDIGIDNQPLF